MLKYAGIMLFFVATIILIVGTPIIVDGFTNPDSALTKTNNNNDVNSLCPKEAKRGPDGRIHIKPGNRTFQTMNEYMEFLTDLYTKGATCIAPRVTPNRSPVDQMLGGLGVGAQPPESTNLEGTARNIETANEDEGPSARTKINKLDDYEYTRVFQQERGNRNVIEKATQSKLLENRILDWANLPFNSEDRATAEDSFVAGRMESGFREPKSGVFFNTVRGADVEPPDVEAARAREQKLLAAYRPTDITQHVIDNETEAVANLVHKVYQEDVNWEPVVTKVGENQWEVAELRPKARKEKWEDEKTNDLAMMESRGLVVPPPMIDIDDRIRNDPYFDKAGVGDRDNNRLWNYKDFNKWTPGLERMFAPTTDNRAWY